MLPSASRATITSPVQWTNPSLKALPLPLPVCSTIRIAGNSSFATRLVSSTESPSTSMTSCTQRGSLLRTCGSDFASLRAGITTLTLRLAGGWWPFEPLRNPFVFGTGSGAGIPSMPLSLRCNVICQLASPWRRPIAGNGNLAFLDRRAKIKVGAVTLPPCRPVPSQLVRGDFLFARLEEVPACLPALSLTLPGKFPLRAASLFCRLCNHRGTVNEVSNGTKTEKQQKIV